mmetsp:Transcript_14176/g.26527  ORF Transcript_14176/g.26527 Transcript_14176/m.26527 type:complete len:227 (-) Transcript_14176:330-1010(-)
MGLVGLFFELVVLCCCAAAVVTNSLLLSSCEMFFLSSGFNGVVGSLGLYRASFPDGNQLDVDSGECVTLDDVDGIDQYKDTAFNCARVCAVVAFFCGLVLFVFGFFKQCLCPLPCTQLLMDISGAAVQIMLALVYTLWLTEACNRYKCTYGDGGTYLFLTQIFWLAASCFTRCMRPGRWERRDEIRANKAKKQEEKERQQAQQALEEERKKNAALEMENQQLREEA